jgi:PAS domain S-box-containing protein
VLSPEAILAGSGVVVLVADASGTLRYWNPPAAECLGLGAATPTTLWDLADADTVRRLLRTVERPRGTQPVVPERLTLRSTAGSYVRLLATVCAIDDPEAQPHVRVVGFDDPTSASDLEHTAELLQGFVETSNEAMWCIEYTEPVDLSQPELDIVRQVFENDCHWSMCNRAMARLYNLPDDLDFNRQRVSAYFRRSPENEAFVRQLVENHFHVDAALSIDVRHDGSLAYVENSVRCHVEGDRMLRMWGTVRDTTEFRTENNRISQREREVREILSALPDAVLVVDKSKRALAVNSAFEATFGWRAAEVLGSDVSHLIDLEVRDGHEQRWFAPTPQRWTTNVKLHDGALLKCDVRIAPLQDDEHRCFVLSLRPERVLPASGAGRRNARPRRNRPLPGAGK